MVMLDSARRRDPVPTLARCLLGLGIAATLAANVAHGLGHGLLGAAVAAWPTVALVGTVADCAIFVRFCRARFGCWEGIRSRDCTSGNHERSEWERTWQPSARDSRTSGPALSAVRAAM